MNKYFIASLCKNGIIGGAIVADDEAITYKTNKLTVPVELRNLKMRYQDIKRTEAGWLFVFPTVSVEMKNGVVHKFVIFDRKGFINLVNNTK